tara:strand:- start:14645 stop:14854 length:210 start_codon:yes stop_codon:yes gene_type:complete
MKNDNISAFAYNTGKAIEELIDKETNNLKDINRNLEASILLYRHKIKHTYMVKDFDNHFNIKIQTEGKI